MEELHDFYSRIQIAMNSLNNELRQAEIMK